MSYKYILCHTNIYYVIQIYAMAYKHIKIYNMSYKCILCQINIYNAIQIYIITNKYIQCHTNIYYVIQTHTMSYFIHILSFNIKEQLQLSITEATYIILG